MTDQQPPQDDDGAKPDPGKRPRTEPIRLEPDAFGRFDVLRAKRQQRPATPAPTPAEDTPLAPLPIQLDPKDKDDEVVVVEDEKDKDAWLGREKTMLPTDKLSAGKDEWVGREATMVPRSKPAAPGGSWDSEWNGTEQTMVGGAAAKPAAPAKDDGAEWTGREKTMVPQSKDEAWVGREATMVGEPVGEWMGREKTMVPGSKPDKPGSGTTGTGTKKPTSPTLLDGWHLKGRKGPLTGRELGDYEIGGILGEGGMGTVYRARQTSLKRRVALKVLPPNLSGDPRLKERFEQEARTASLINSVHAVQVFAAGQIEDVVFFAMEFVEGTDLAAVIDEKKAKNEPFRPEEAAGYIIQAGKGLAEAGRHGIVHRDIKPANLMITTGGVVKIADFGISKVAGEHSLTMTGTAVGTPAYVSPEQGRGDHVDGRSDLYSLGIVFYELLTGIKPFDGATANALIYQHNYAEPKLPKDIRGDLPDEYQAVALKCLQKDPAKRYQTADELVADLERIRAGSAPMTAMLEVFGTGADEAMRRLGIKQRRVLPYLIAATLVLAAVGGGLAWWYGRQSEVSRLRVKLAQLDKAEPPASGMRDDLAKLTKIVGEKDADVARWSGKLVKIGGLETRLGRLDGLELVPLALHDESERDLADYATLIGGSGPLYDRWHGEIGTADARAGDLRARLGKEIDGAGLTTVAQRDALQPALDELKVRAGESDADVQRWRGKMDEFAKRLETLKGRLHALDDDGAQIRQAELAQLGVDLQAAKGMLGADDTDCLRWESRWRSRGAGIEALKQTLARIDQGDLPSRATLQAVAADLATYGQLVDADDPDLKKWTAKAAASHQTDASLCARLARLDDQKPLTAVEQDALADALASLKPIAGEDDQDCARWALRLRNETARVETLKSALARLDDPAPMTVEQQDAAEKAIAELDDRGRIGDADKRHATRRLDEQKARLAALRERLAALDQVGPLPAALAKDLEEAKRLIGARDADVARWSAKAAAVEELRGKLKPLDAAETPPADAEALIAKLAALLGDDDGDVVRWRGKAKKIAALATALAHLDHETAITVDDVDKVGDYVALVGADDPAAKRWTAKTGRAAELKKALAALDDTYILPDAAQAEADEYATLVGADEPSCAAARARIVVLRGPTSAPAWAQASGRDRNGPWVELTVTPKGSRTAVKQRLRYVPAGAFVIGSPDSEAGRDRDETRCRVTLTRSFWMADSETTQALWEAVGAEHDSRFRADERPVERVSWNDCQVFLTKLNNAVPGLSAAALDFKARLPTEAEWEYACRAGSKAPFSDAEGDLGLDRLDTIAWCARTAQSTKEVKRRQPNLLGLFDMHGNVWEWCQDRYGTYSPTPISDPLGREEDTRVARGGSWGDQPLKLRSANRLAVMPDMRTVYLGMRFCISATLPDTRVAAAR